MKNWIFSFALVSVAFLSCDSDDTVSPTMTEVETIAFSTETNQDQMGDFSMNKVLYHDGQFWSIGGENSYSPAGEPSSDVWKSSNGVNWVSVTSNQFNDKRYHQMAVFAGQMWLVGGEDGAGGIEGGIYSSTDGNTWTLRHITTASFGFASQGTLSGKDGKLWLIKRGGIDGMDVWSSSDGITWVEETLDAFPNTRWFETVVFDGVFYALGGIDVTNTAVNNVWRSADGVNWTQVTPTTPIFSPRGYHTATVHDGKIWVVGGENSGSKLNDIWYSSDGTSWVQYIPGGDFAGGLSHHAAISQGGALWIMGGKEPAGNTGKIRKLTVL